MVLGCLKLEVHLSTALAGVFYWQSHGLFRLLSKSKTKMYSLHPPLLSIFSLTVSQNEDVVERFMKENCSAGKFHLPWMMSPAPTSHVQFLTYKAIIHAALWIAHLVSVLLFEFAEKWQLCDLFDRVSGDWCCQRLALQEWTDSEDAALWSCDITN